MWEVRQAVSLPSRPPCSVGSLESVHKQHSHTGARMGVERKESEA